MRLEHKPQWRYRRQNLFFLTKIFTVTEPSKKQKAKTTSTIKTHQAASRKNTQQPQKKPKK
jgi:hypothetical protein